jgi:hypothetical protein
MVCRCLLWVVVGFFVARVCSKCRKSRLSRYRADIFVDSNYETDEQIDDDY